MTAVILTTYTPTLVTTASSASIVGALIGLALLVVIHRRTVR